MQHINISMNLGECITKQCELLEKANSVDYGLHHKEKPRISFWCYVWENFKKEFKVILRF